MDPFSKLVNLSPASLSGSGKPTQNSGPSLNSIGQQQVKSAFNAMGQQKQQPQPQNFGAFGSKSNATNYNQNNNIDDLLF